MGTTLEQYARFRFPGLQKRKREEKGKKGTESGYDQMLLNTSGTNVYIEQKSSGHWGDNDYKWQRVAIKHKWNMLLLCGIDYQDVKFWGMDRNTFNRLILEGKITNQGNKSEESSQGRWFNYSVVKDSLVRIETIEDLTRFVSSLPAVA